VGEGEESPSIWDGENLQTLNGGEETFKERGGERVIRVNQVFKGKKLRKKKGGKKRRYLSQKKKGDDIVVFIPAIRKLKKGGRGRRFFLSHWGGE